MTRRTLATAAVASIALVYAQGAAFAQAPSAADKAATEKTIMANERAVNDAIAKNDMKAFSSFVTDDGVDVEGTGVMKKPEILKMLADVKVQSYAISNDQFVWLDSTHVVHVYKWTGKSTYMGQAAPDQSWASTIWVNRGGKWLALFHQESPIMPMPAPKK